MPSASPTQAYPSPEEKRDFVAQSSLRSGLDLDWRMDPDEEEAKGLREEGL